MKNSATLWNSGILTAYQGKKTAEQRNCSGIRQLESNWRSGELFPSFLPRRVAQRGCNFDANQDSTTRGRKM
jgi:hypothetical protein